jgi:hypothetical protein
MQLQNLIIVAWSQAGKCGFKYVILTSRRLVRALDHKDISTLASSHVITGRKRIHSLYSQNWEISSQRCSTLADLLCCPSIISSYRSDNS